jgi:hypothetical protein
VRVRSVRVWECGSVGVWEWECGSVKGCAGVEWLMFGLTWTYFKSLSGVVLVVLTQGLGLTDLF